MSICRRCQGLRVSSYPEKAGAQAEWQDSKGCIKLDLQHESVASYLNQSGNTPLATQDSMLTALTPYASMNMRQDHDHIAKALASGRQNSIGSQDIIHHRAGLRRGQGDRERCPAACQPQGGSPCPCRQHRTWATSESHLSPSCQPPTPPPPSPPGLAMA